MNKKVHIGAKGPSIILTDKLYRASGGEASIYVNAGIAFKVYHDSSKFLPLIKIQELHKITNLQVITPQDTLFDSKGAAIGYVTKFIDDAEPLLKFFTRTFKDQNGIDHKMIAELVKRMQLVTTDIHAAQCLIVDYNELNVLVHQTPNVLTPFFIDTDSYATPSFKATAIMDSVRDRRVSRVSGGHVDYNPDALSDWFSWGILAFWLYSNIHPFRGNHPKYKPRDKSKQMDDGISVFHKGVRTPPSVNNFSVIPKRHLDWFKDTFLDNNRSVPPLPDSIAPIAVPSQIITITSSSQIEVTEVASYPITVIDAYQFFGINYVVTKIAICSRDRVALDFGGVINKYKKVILCTASDGTVIAGMLSGNIVFFIEVNTNKPIGTTAGNDLFVRNNAIYTISHGKLVENSFTTFGAKIIHRVAELENISNYSATMYNGCVIQDLLGKIYLTLPYAKGRCFSRHISELDGHRIVEAKSEQHVVVVLGEKGGKYNRFVLTFDKTFQNHIMRAVLDVAYEAINFTVTESGVCLLLANSNELEMFTDNKGVAVIYDPPFDSTMKLFSTPEGAFFINNNSIHRIKSK